MSDPYRCRKCGGSSFHVDTSFGTPQRVLVTCKSYAATELPGGICGWSGYGPSITAAFEAISRKVEEAADAGTKRSV